MSQSWCDHFRPIIAAVLREHSADSPERRKALREARAWLAEVRGEGKPCQK